MLVVGELGETLFQCRLKRRLVAIVGLLVGVDAIGQRLQLLGELRTHLFACRLDLLGHGRDRLRQLSLDGRRLEIPHPITKAIMAFEALPSEAFNRLKEKF